MPSTQRAGFGLTGASGGGEGVVLGGGRESKVGGRVKGREEG